MVAPAFDVCPKWRTALSSDSRRSLASFEPLAGSLGRRCRIRGVLEEMAIIHTVALRDWLATPLGVTPISVDFDLVAADVQALLGMGVIDREKISTDMVYNRLSHRSVMGKMDGRLLFSDNLLFLLKRSRRGHVYVLSTKYTERTSHTANFQTTLVIIPSFPD